eukprot:TRINITY_DN69614_c0_g1_i1.p1 TRINITY_DN69614_c0_g1~~TRINITY_DN69614_c0_g1_i1.p1  ORF type:complete len:412 (+),score=42.90 TRINITY_DN69614_c0_g1_i1:61-1236(+)
MADGSRYDRLRPSVWSQPAPLELPEAWVCVPLGFNYFYRCALCADKLGLSLRPLPPQDERQSCNVPTIEAPVSKTNDLHFWSQMLSLPTTSVVDIIEDPARARALVCAEVARVAGLYKRPFFRRLPMPKDRPDIPEPPHSSVLCILVKDALACQGYKVRRRSPPNAPRGDNGASDVGIRELGGVPPRAESEDVLVALCFAHQSEATLFVSHMRALRRYALALSFGPIPDRHVSIAMPASQLVPCSSAAQQHPSIGQEGNDILGVCRTPPTAETDCRDGTFVHQSVASGGVAMVEGAFGDMRRQGGFVTHRAHVAGDRSIMDCLSEGLLTSEELDKAMAVLSAAPPQPDPNRPSRMPCMALTREGTVLWHMPKKAKPFALRQPLIGRFHSIG